MGPLLYFLSGFAMNILMHFLNKFIGNHVSSLSVGTSNAVLLVHLLINYSGNLRKRVAFFLLPNWRYISTFVFENL